MNGKMRCGILQHRHEACRRVGGFANTKVIDPRLIFRLQDLEQFEKWYALEHAPLNCLKAQFMVIPIKPWKVKQATFIINPGCYQQLCNWV